MDKITKIYFFKIHKKPFMIRLSFNPLATFIGIFLIACLAAGGIYVSSQENKKQKLASINKVINLPSQDKFDDTTFDDNDKNWYRPASFSEVDNDSLIYLVPDITGLVADTNEAPLIPVVLTGSDVDTYQKIFAAQRDGDIAKANIEIRKLDNYILIGYVLSERYLSNNYKPIKKELEFWLDNFGDHPQYNNIATTATKATSLNVAEKNSEPYLYGYGDHNGLSGSVTRIIDQQDWRDRKKAQLIWTRLKKIIEEGNINKAEKLMESEKIQQFMEPIEVDVTHWYIASHYLYQGKAKRAYNLLESASARSGNKTPGMYWTTGLAAYRSGNFSKAAENFVKLANAGKVSIWQKSAGAFWAYKSYGKLNNNSKAQDMLREASAYPYTFYGLLARRAQDDKLNFDFTADTKLKRDDLKSLARNPAVARSIALTQIGRISDAEEELRRFFPTAGQADKVKLMKLAERMHMPGLQVRMANNLRANENLTFDASNYPIPHWRPHDGYQIDPALIYALIRHESGFNPEAKSHAGAVGLMQLMPQTAKQVSAKANIKTSEGLTDPETNITIAQKYIKQLLSDREVSNNLFYFSAAYNAGPGKLSEWRDSVNYNQDPLLFIESLPARETRNFITQVMTNYWIYSERMQSNGIKTLDMVLNGKWPIYIEKDSDQEFAVLPADAKVGN